MLLDDASVEQPEQTTAQRGKVGVTAFYTLSVTDFPDDG
jgi:hypothetical protein